MDKVIVDGKVAVLVSGGYGGGWSTWMEEVEVGDIWECVQPNLSIVFEPKVVEMVLAGEKDKNRAERKATLDKIIGYMTETYPGYYTGGAEGLKVEWVPVGSKFYIEEYDGNESLVLESDMNWQIA